MATPRRLGFMVAALALGLAGSAYASLPRPAPLTLKLSPIQVASKIERLKAKPGAVALPAAPAGTQEPRLPADSRTEPIQFPPALTTAQRITLVRTRGFNVVYAPDDTPDNFTLTPHQPYLHGVGINLPSYFSPIVGFHTSEPNPAWPYGPLMHTSYYALLDIQARAGERYVIDFGLTTWECLKANSCAPHLESYELITSETTTTAKVAQGLDMHVLAVVEAAGDGHVQLLIGRKGTSPSKSSHVLIRSVNIARVAKP